MKEKIEQLAKGKFEYTTPKVLLSEEQIELSVEEGKTYHGSFTIRNSDNSSMKGVIYSSHQLFHVLDQTFLGKENVIEYEIKGNHVNAGEVMKGTITIVSNYGEIEVPYEVEVELPYCITSIGKIKDLFQFANLAKSDWQEALKLFKSEEFVRVFLKNEERDRLIYEGLLKGRSSSMALEEFLIAVHKKERINLSIDKLRDNYEIGKEPFMDKVVISKDNWGFAEIRVSTDAPFIELDRKIIWSDNFLGNNFPLEYVINPEHMRNGINYGRIYIKTIHQTMVIELSCRYHKNARVRDTEYHQKKINETLLIKTYLDFRLGRITSEEYKNKLSDVITIFSTIENRDLQGDLLKTYLYIINHDEDKTKLMLEHFKEVSENLKKDAPITYSGYLYLNALYNKEDSTILEVVKEIWEIYNNENDDIEILWFLLYLDKKFDLNKQSKLQELKKQFSRGCRSPILYYEAFSVFKEDSSLLNELGNFEIQVIHWATKNQYRNEEVAIQYVYLAGRMKSFHRLVFENLVDFYGHYQSKDVLTAICSMLIKGHKTSTKYFIWYQLGVEAQLRITELHEYYMYAIDETKDVTLAQPILLYYIYNSSLNDKKKAYLYSRIIKDKDKNPSIYRTYITKIESFALKQIKLHCASENLSVIYDDVLKKEMIDEELAGHLPQIMFQYEVQITNKNIKGVYVVHKELEGEIYVPVVDGHALMHIYTNNPIIYLVDQFDNRFITTVDYTINKLIHSKEFEEKCYSLNPSEAMLTLHMAELMQSYEKNDYESIEIRKRALRIPNLREDYIRTYLKSLIYYYYDNFEGDLLEDYLTNIDLDKLHKSERDRIIEYMISKKLYMRAYDMTKEYGVDGIGVESLEKLMINYIKEKKEEKDEFLLQLGFQVFSKGKYNSTIINYLLSYYFGTTNEMLQLYQGTCNLDVDTMELEERLLAQMLFANSHLEDSLNVFKRYKKQGKNHSLIKAYLSFIAYEYVVHDQEFSKELLQDMKEEVLYEENDVCTLAILKNYKEEKELTEEEVKYIELKIGEFLDKGIVLGFFREFKGRVKLPESIVNSFFVEYKASPKKKVFIHYLLSSSLNEEENYITEPMNHVYQGIFVTSFLLFYGETLQYYITEESDEKKVVTESISATLDNKLEAEDELETRYNQINLMLMAKELNDEKALIEMIKTYKQKELVAFELFTAL